MRPASWLHVLGLLLATSAIAAEPQDFLRLYAEQAQREDPAFQGFSAERGRAFYLQPHAVENEGTFSCASCHHPDPRKATEAHRDQIPCRACHVLFSSQPESHRPTRRHIPPFAPGANPERFTSEWKVEHFFGYNCTLLLKRPCTAQEKGDLITWLLTVQ
jgi:hypothetical protein